MFTTAQIQRAKAVPIIDVLASRGVTPVSRMESEWAYRSPVTQECSPSFFVNPAKNVFADYSGQQHGDVIRLVQYMTGCAFTEAVEMLLNFADSSNAPIFSFSGPCSKVFATEGATDNPSLSIVAIRPLTHPALVEYVHARGIDIDLARRYCQQVHYRQRTGREFFSVGFANDQGGFALRGPTFKGQSPPAAHTTLAVPESTAVNLFEGFFDFLSACQHFGLPTRTTVVLNSTSNLASALPALRSYKRVDAYLDQDKAGRKAIQRLLQAGVAVQDRSEVYASHKDFNEFLLSRPIAAPPDAK